MEEKGGTKHSRSSVSSSSSSSDGASTQPLSLSSSPPPSGSPPKVSSHWPPSPVQEHGSPSEEISVVDLSSDEEDGLPETSRDEEFTQKLFGDLNHGLLRPPSDGNIIILSDSDEEEVMHEEDTVNVEAAPSSTMNSSASIVSTVDTDDAPEGVQDDNSDGGGEAGSPYAAVTKGVYAGSGR
jgi:hypothetical protein